MPNITVEISHMEKDQKRALIESFTKSASEITGIPEQAFTITIHENNPDNIGVGGKLLSERMK